MDECSVWSYMSTERSTRLLCPSPPVDLALAEVAERQHGVVARWQLLDLGIGDSRIKGRLRRRQLHPIHRGVYAIGFRQATKEARWMAAVLACGPGAVLSHRSAARIWGLSPGSSRAIEVTRTRGWRAPDGVVVHRGPVPADERTEVEGIPVTTVPRTVLDYAVGASRREVERALNEMEVQQLRDALSIRDLLARYPRRRGSAVVRALLDEGAETRGVTKRELEERFAALIERHGLARPRRNADLAVRGRLFNVDCLWPDARLVVELDSRAVHGTRKAFETDRGRDRLMLADGWRVMRITWAQLRDEEEAVAADLRAALPRAALRFVA